MSRALDLYLVYEFIRRLSIPWEETDAYKLEIIDDKGNKTGKKPSTKEEKDAYTPYDRLIFNVKRLFEKFGLKSKVATYAGALFLIKECDTIPYHLIDDDKYLYERIQEEMDTIMNNTESKKTIKDIMEITKVVSESKTQSKPVELLVNPQIKPAHPKYKIAQNYVDTWNKKSSDQKTLFKAMLTFEKLHGRNIIHMDRVGLGEEAPANATGSAVAGTGDSGVHWSKKQPRIGEKGKQKKYGQPIDAKRILKRYASIKNSTNL